MAKKIDSNIVGLSFAEELTLGVLPGVSEANAVWYPLEPNEFDDFGGEIATVKRAPISASRQTRKGTTTDIEAGGGFQQDFTQSNLNRLLQGFFFADAREQPSTHPISGAAGVTVTMANFTASNAINVGTGHGTKFKAGMIIRTSGNVNAANNVNDAVIASITGDALTTQKTFVSETVVAGVSRLDVIGFELPVSTAALVVSGGVATITRPSGTFLDFGLTPGQWIFVGGDIANSSFAQGKFYCRVKSISALALVVDEISLANPISETASGSIKVQFYIPTMLRNEKTPSLIKRRSYNLERTLGQDENGVQSEYLIGSVPNEFSLEIGSTDKIMSELSFVALNNILRDGTTGVKAGTRMALVSEDAFNTSANVYQMRLYVHNTGAVTPASVFEYVREASLTVNNNVTGLKAIGTVGNFEMNVGDFEVSGELEVYFSNVAAISAVKNNSDVGFNIIAAMRNAGFIFDIPLLQLGGGRAEVEKDEPVLLPVEQMGAENAFGFTLSYCNFKYLPTAAMPVVQ